jgi:serine protease AprX
MKASLGVGWDDKRKGAALAALAALSLSLFMPSRAGSDASPLVTVIVREVASAGHAAEDAVETLGGEVGRQLSIINGFVAKVPRAMVGSLAHSFGVRSVTLDSQVHLEAQSYNPSSDTGSMSNTNNSLKTSDFWKSGVTGRGIDVAVIDSGVAPVAGLSDAGKVVNGPDLSYESQADNLRYLDSFGHGTHVAGIIAGRDSTVASGKEGQNSSDFVGVAPDARIVNMKVANAVGATDVSQVIAAIDWVVQHRHSDGLNIRVLNLSFGTDSAQSYLVDPLAYAAEVAWRKGIVVVVSAGNRDFGDARLNDPAYDPYVLAVGANDGKGTYEVSDDVVPTWSAHGDGIRNPDLVAPGKSLVSLRVPNSHIDLTHPEGRVADRFFRGSGTSQAAAVVSGAAALLLQQRPELTPDQVKYILTSSASRIPTADPLAQGSGTLNLRNAFRAPTPAYAQAWPTSTGVGSLEAARGSLHVTSVDGSVLTGEQDLMGTAWDGAGWSAASWNETSWQGGNWNGAGWSGAGWSGAGWSGAGWSGAGWSGAGWSGAGWSGASWGGD